MTRKQKQFGFSLIELVVAMAMIAILSAMVLTKYRTGEKSKRVQFAADTVITTLRTAQNYAQSGVVIPASNCNLGKSAMYYQVTFINNATSVSIRALDKCGRNFSLLDSPLPQDTRVRALNGLKVDGVNRSPLSIKFNPPFAKMEASSGLPSGAVVSFTLVSITLESSDGTFVRTVEVDGLTGKIQ